MRAVERGNKVCGAGGRRVGGRGDHARVPARQVVQYMHRVGLEREPCLCA